MSPSKTPIPFTHRPVMVTEVVEIFRPVPPGVVVDATVGGGGHAAALLAAHSQVELVGLDRDREAIAAATTALAGFGGRVTLRHARFDELGTILQELGHGTVTGALFDLGVSSVQLDRADRGFSYRPEADGPLDMRMDQAHPRTAADVVNGEPEAELVRILRTYGEERFAVRIAKAIVAARGVRPLTTTGELAKVITSAIPAPARRRGGHPAKRSFQAIRIAVNCELELLGPALDQALNLLASRGRCAVLAYHSLEDRLVKQRFADAITGGCTCPPGLPCACGATPTVTPVFRGARKPTADEVAANPRAQSARLRAVEKLPVPASGTSPTGGSAEEPTEE